jgi:Fe-S cluster assembly protein SufD
LGDERVGSGSRRVTIPAVATGAAENYAVAFDQFSSDGVTSPALQTLRRAGFERFATLGFPTTKNEDWHFTSVSSIADQEFVPLTSRSGDVSRDELAQFQFGARDWHTMVFVNGRFEASLSDLKSLPKGVRTIDLASAWTDAPELASRVGKIASFENAAFTALNAAFTSDGAVVHIAKDTQIAKPIHLLFVTDATAAKGMIHPRNLIVIDRHASATVIESYVSLAEAMYLTNAVTEVAVAEGATLRHLKMQREAARAFHVGTIETTQAKDSHYVSFSLSTGALLARSNIYTTLNGEGCGAT